MYHPCCLLAIMDNPEKGEKALTAAETICAEIPFRSDSRITEPWTENESWSFFFLCNAKISSHFTIFRTHNHQRSCYMHKQFWKKTLIPFCKHSDKAKELKCLAKLCQLQYSSKPLCSVKEKHPKKEQKNSLPIYTQATGQFTIYKPAEILPSLNLTWPYCFLPEYKIYRRKFNPEWGITDPYLTDLAKTLQRVH